MSTERKTLPSLGALLATGVRTLRAYSGLFVCMYLVQLAVASGAGVLMSRIMGTTWANNPVFDRAIDGDLAAFAAVLRDTPEVVAALVWVVLGTVATYAVLSWYLAGGLNAVLLAGPRGRAAIVRTFGAGGAATFLAYVRLALLSLVPYAVIAVLAGIGFAAVSERLEYAITGTELLSALATALAVPAVLAWLHRTALAYARLTLSQRALAEHDQDTRLPAARALIHGYRTALAGWKPLVHVLLYVLWFAGVTSVLMAMTPDSSMAGAGGALALLMLRQVASVLRAAGALVLAAGQTLLFRARA